MSVCLSVLQAIELRPLTALTEEQHLEVLAIRNEESVRSAMFTSHEIGREEHLAWVEKLADNRSVEMFALFHNGALAGSIGLTEFDRRNMRANWAYYLTERVRGQGVGIAGEYKFLDTVFSSIGLEKLNGEVLAFNVKVLALHQRFGFVEEGVRRKHIRRDGNWIDCVLIGLTSEEWLQGREAVRNAQFGC